MAVHVNKKRSAPAKNQSLRSVEKTSKDPRCDAMHENKLWEFFRGNYRWLTVLFLGLCSSALHWKHLYTLFENDKHFSHLSELEREMAFRTEMGLYYSYYKTIIGASSFVDGLSAITRDNVTEYPDVINTLKRFNLYPEVALGAAFRVFTAATTALNVKTKDCWSVDRGEGKSPVLSCEGVGDPMYFYVHCVMLLNGLMMGLIFVFGTFLSESIFGGLIAVASFFFNHGECTRVMWTASLRESHAFPFFILQMFIVTYVLRQQEVSHKHSALIGITSICFVLPWQFAQFTLMTQVLAVFGCYMLQYVDRSKMLCVLQGHMLGLLSSYVLLFGNEMLLTSWYFSTLVAILVNMVFSRHLERLLPVIIIWVVQGLLLLVLTVGVKAVMSLMLGVADDAHIGDILRSKFGSFNNFHTMLYTCAKEFDFMDPETPGRLMFTLLLPTAFTGVAGAAIFLGHRDVLNWRYGMTVGIRFGKDRKDFRGKDHAEIVYSLLQLACFTVMAIIIMRLKVFWTPHMCLMASLVASRDFFGFYTYLEDKRVHRAVLVALLAVMATTGSTNLRQQWSIKGEFSNYPLEELIDWVNSSTDSNAVFAGPMPTMANLKLSTHRAVVNHPHYEDANLRARTLKVYSMYSRKPVKEVKDMLTSLQADYIVLEMSWCTRRPRPGCSMPEIWDVEDPANSGKTPACEIINQKAAPHFKVAFRNGVYTVLTLVKST